MGVTLFITGDMTFICIEAAILEDTVGIEGAIMAADQQSIVDNAASIARRSNRILQVAQQEVDNSEDPVFQQDVTDATNNLKAGELMGMMVSEISAVVKVIGSRVCEWGWKNLQFSYSFF